MVTRNQKPTIETQKTKRKKPKHNTNGNHQTTKEGTKRRRKENYKNNQETSNKMAMSTYLSIITLNVNGLGTSLVESACQCRGHRFNPWSRKIPHATEQLSPCTTTTEPAL